jgi:hypothetical protein
MHGNKAKSTGYSGHFIRDGYRKWMYSTPVSYFYRAPRQTNPTTLLPFRLLTIWSYISCRHSTLANACEPIVFGGVRGVSVGADPRAEWPRSFDSRAIHTRPAEAVCPRSHNAGFITPPAPAPKAHGCLVYMLDLGEHIATLCSSYRHTGHVHPPSCQTSYFVFAFRF